MGALGRATRRAGYDLGLDKVAAYLEAERQKEERAQWAKNVLNAYNKAGSELKTVGQGINENELTTLPGDMQTVKKQLPRVKQKYNLVGDQVYTDGTTEPPENYTLPAGLSPGIPLMRKQVSQLPVQDVKSLGMSNANISSTKPGESSQAGKSTYDLTNFSPEQLRNLLSLSPVESTEQTGFNPITPSTPTRTTEGLSRPEVTTENELPNYLLGDLAPADMDNDTSKFPESYETTEQLPSDILLGDILPDKSAEKYNLAKQVLDAYNNSMAGNILSEYADPARINALTGILSGQVEGMKPKEKKFETLSEGQILVDPDTKEVIMQNLKNIKPDDKIINIKKYDEYMVVTYGQVNEKGEPVGPGTKVESIKYKDLNSGSAWLKSGSGEDKEGVVDVSQIVDDLNYYASQLSNTDKDDEGYSKLWDSAKAKTEALISKLDYKTPDNPRYQHMIDNVWTNYAKQGKTLNDFFAEANEYAKETETPTLTQRDKNILTAYFKVRMPGIVIDYRGKLKNLPKKKTVLNNPNNSVGDYVQD